MLVYLGVNAAASAVFALFRASVPDRETVLSANNNNTAPNGAVSLATVRLVRHQAGCSRLASGIANAVSRVGAVEAGSEKKSMAAFNSCAICSS